MKIKNSKNAKNVLACMVAVEMFAMQFFVPPYIIEEKFVISLPFRQNSEEDDEKNKNTNTRKLVKKNASIQNSNNKQVHYDTSYHRNARNSLRKPNYYGKK